MDNYLKSKLFSLMKTYTRQQFVKDIISGIIVAVIALPLSIALALASGVGPEKGLYTAIVAGFTEKIGKENFCENIDEALHRAEMIIKNKKVY